MRNRQRQRGGMTMYMGIALLIVIASSAAYFKYSQDKLAEANQLVAVERAGRASAEANLKFLQESHRKQQEAIGRLATASAIIRKEQEITIDIFAEHDLKALAERKPGLIERRVNAATERVFNNLEEITDPLSYVSKPGGEFVKDAE